MIVSFYAINSHNYVYLLTFVTVVFDGDAVVFTVDGVAVVFTMFKKTSIGSMLYEYVTFSRLSAGVVPPKDLA